MQFSPSSKRNIDVVARAALVKAPLERWLSRLQLSSAAIDHFCGAPDKPMAAIPFAPLLSTHE